MWREKWIYVSSIPIFQLVDDLKTHSLLSRHLQESIATFKDQWPNSSSDKNQAFAEKKKWAATDNETWVIMRFTWPTNVRKFRAIVTASPRKEHKFPGIFLLGAKFPWGRIGRAPRRTTTALPEVLRRFPPKCREARTILTKCCVDAVITFRSFLANVPGLTAALVSLTNNGLRTYLLFRFEQNAKTEEQLGLGHSRAGRKHCIKVSWSRKKYLRKSFFIAVIIKSQFILFNLFFKIKI